MTLSEAIRVGKTYMEGSNEADPVTFDTALLLLIKAGERCKYIDEHTERWSGVLLPGEETK